MAKSTAAPMARPQSPPRRMATRAKNLTARPGLPDLAGWNPDEPDRIPLPPAQRREEAAAARQANEENAARKVAVREVAILQAARIEDRKLEEDRAADDARRKPKRPRPKPRYVKPTVPSHDNGKCQCCSKLYGELTLLMIQALMVLRRWPTLQQPRLGLSHQAAFPRALLLLLKHPFSPMRSPTRPWLAWRTTNQCRVSCCLYCLLCFMLTLLTRCGAETEASGWVSDDQESRELVIESEASASEFEPEDDMQQQSDDDEEEEVVQPEKNAGRCQGKVHRTDVTAARTDAAAPKRKSVTSTMTVENAG